MDVSPIIFFFCPTTHSEAFSLHLMGPSHCLPCISQRRQEHSWPTPGFPLCPSFSDSHSLSGGVNTTSLLGILFFHPILNQALQHPSRNRVGALTSQRDIFIFLRLTMSSSELLKSFQLENSRKINTEGNVFHIVSLLCRPLRLQSVAAGSGSSSSHQRPFSSEPSQPLPSLVVNL